MNSRRGGRVKAAPIGDWDGLEGLFEGLVSRVKSSIKFAPGCSFPVQWLDSDDKPPRPVSSVCLTLAPQPFMGTGLQTTSGIPVDRLITWYGGELCTKTSWNFNSPYVFEVTYKGITLYLDGAESNTLGRYINHSCEPNAIAHQYIFAGTLMIAIVSTRHIAAGEFISIKYDDDIHKYGFIHTCMCGTASCIDKDKYLEAVLFGPQPVSFTLPGNGCQGGLPKF